MHSVPYISKRQLVALIEDGYAIDVVSLANAGKTSAVWYGEWVIQVPEQRGETERFLVATGRGTAPKMRICKTTNGVVSLMHELGFRDICIPMEEGGSASHCLGKAPAATGGKTLSAEPDAPVSLDAVKSGLLCLSYHGFVSARQAPELVEAGYARPITLHVLPDGDYWHRMEGIALTKAGEATVRMVDELENIMPLDAGAIPEWERVVTEYYIEEQAFLGVYASRITCAKNWYTGDEPPEVRRIAQPPVRMQLKPRRQRRA
ncbi:hypothetical protein FDP25_16690 [Roseovarius sp. A21]|uniref:Uncharacterized protein n=1 Tax=Roseovarius bejariae TaxID=2576383 RepID=A0A844D2R8_9RHOB|nr:hypothetical protein [Roseovarius bejariae]MRU17080.1 hypothetical protein [Roseovarius bejariae]